MKTYLVILTTAEKPIVFKGELAVSNDLFTSFTKEDGGSLSFHNRYIVLVEEVIPEGNT